VKVTATLTCLRELQVSDYDNGNEQMSDVENVQETSTATALTNALERIGDRWTLLTVAALLDGPRRFGELAEAVEGISTNVLTSRLRALERLGLVVASPYSDRPPRFEYQLAEAGRELADAIRLLSAWGAEAGPNPSGLIHAACATNLEVRYYCPTCDEVVTDADEIWV
jgi:DNA-binding HxlR family transcriptional regulator